MGMYCNLQQGGGQSQNLPQDNGMLVPLAQSCIGLHQCWKVGKIGPSTSIAPNLQI